MSLNMIKANNLNDKLFKCYSQIGLCNDENVFFGKGSIEKESNFLYLLTLFIRNLHLADNELLNHEKTIIKSEKENLDTNDNVDDEISKKKEDETELKQEKETEELSNTLPTESLKKKSNINTLCSDIEEIKKEFNDRCHKSYEQSMQNFNSSFKNVSSLSTQSIQTNTASEVNNNISSNLQKIHSTFLTVNKTLSNKTKINNQPVLENSTVIMETLSSVIKDNLVLVEQACNTFIED